MKHGSKKLSVSNIKATLRIIIIMCFLEQLSREQEAQAMGVGL